MYNSSAHLEIHPNGGDMVIPKGTLGKSQENTGLSAVVIPDDYDFEEVIVL